MVLSMNTGSCQTDTLLSLELIKKKDAADFNKIKVIRINEDPLRFTLLCYQLRQKTIADFY